MIVYDKIVREKFGLFLEAAIEIKFDCLQPVGEIVGGNKGVYAFATKPKYKKRKLEFEALTDFLNIPMLSMGSDIERNLARHDFYKRWGFLTASNLDTRTSETDAEFDKFQKELCDLNIKRLKGQLKNTDEFKFSVPELITWGVKKYEETNLAVPVYSPPNLSNALYLSWFFGARELAGMKTCKRFEVDGAKSGCSVFFKPTRKDQDYCGKPCAKAFHEKRRPKRKRK